MCCKGSRSRVYRFVGSCWKTCRPSSSIAWRYGLENDDIVIDTGNGNGRIPRRVKWATKANCASFSTAVSGGEEGARVGHNRAVWQNQRRMLKPMWEAVLQKWMLMGLPVGQFEAGEACAAYVGPSGTGHYVKMVHNGIEYADMQLICESVPFHAWCAWNASSEIGQVFDQWNNGVLNGYLMGNQCLIFFNKKML